MSETVPSIANSTSVVAEESSARNIFLAADPLIQELIKKIVTKEKEVMHMRRRPSIHQDICEFFKDTIR